MGRSATQSDTAARRRTRAARSTARRPRRKATARPATIRRVALGAGGLLVALFLLAVLERVVYAGEVMPGVEVEGATVARLGERDAFAELSALAVAIETEPVHARIGDRTLVADASLLDVDIDERATLRAARRAGRSSNPLEQTTGAVLRRLRPEKVDLRVSFSDDGLDGVLDGWQREILDGNVEGDVRFEGTTVVEIEPQAGTGIVRDEARRRLVEVMGIRDRPVVELPIGRVEPRISREEVARVAAQARALLAGPFELVTFGSTLAITPEQLATAMGTRAQDHRLELTVDPDRLRGALGEALTALETDPVDARFEVTSAGGVRVVPSENGRQVDMAGVSAAILDGQRRIVAPLDEVVPARDTAWAEALGIKEQVSTFTTNHPSGQPRVTNIHRSADIINGLVVEPGQTFSLNDAIGPRTVERGFVVAPVFYGEFTEDVGGGVSQLATTFFNAVFFGGYEDVYHKPHTIYISRYPMGREATVNYPTVDLKFRNDSAAGILIRTSYTASSITVTFYGDKEGKVVREEGRKILAERPVEDLAIPCPAPPEVDKNGDCATLTFAQTKRIEQGLAGYDVEFFRVIERPGREPQRERFFWRYRMTPNRILVGTAAPETTLPPETTTTPAPPPTTTTAAPPGTTEPTAPPSP